MTPEPIPPALRLARWLGWREIPVTDHQAIGEAILKAEPSFYYRSDRGVCPCWNSARGGFNAPFRPAESIADAELLLVHAATLGWQTSLAVATGDVSAEVTSLAGRWLGRARAVSTLNIPAAITEAILEAIDAAGEP